MKHKWQKTSDGKINTWASYGEYCNGPRCIECGYTFCEHCYPKGYDEECPGRAGFKIYRDNLTYNWHGKLLGFRWDSKCFYVGFWFITIVFDFSGLFPYCEEVKND
jgi:hypothetical protein